MGLDITHYEIIPNDGKTSRSEVFNVANYPDEFKEKFKNFFFFEDVTYIDWEATVHKLMQMSFGDFCEQFDEYMETSEGVHMFCTKDHENPFEDPQRFAIHENQCEKVTQSDPHVRAICIGYQRKCMTSEFFTRFDGFQIVMDESTVKEMSKFCDGSECVETFIDQFIINWTQTSFVEVNY